jgi:hypothetical protein
MRAGVRIGVGCVSFLCAYTALHLLHVAGLDPTPVRALSSIPLFAGFLAAAACAAATAIVSGAIIRDHRRLARALPAAVALSSAAFAAAAALFP